MKSSKNNFMEYIFRSFLIVLPLFGVLFIYDAAIQFISLLNLIIIFSLSYVLQRTKNFSVLPVLIFFYAFFFGFTLASPWLLKISSVWIFVSLLVIFAISLLISAIASFSIYSELSREYTISEKIQTDLGNKQQPSEKDTDLEAEMAYIRSNFILISDDISGTVEPKLKAISDSLEKRKSELEQNFQDYTIISMNLSELYDSCISMKNRLSSFSNYIKRIFSILEKYLEVSNSLKIPSDKSFSFSYQGYSDLYKNQISDLRDKAKKLESSLDSLQIFLRDSNEETGLDIHSIVLSIKPSIIEFLRIHYNSYVVSLKTVQIASTSGSSLVRKSLLAIIQDIDSFSFKLSVQINNILQLFSDFEPQISLFDTSIRENIKQLTQLRTRIRRIRDMYYGSVQRRLMAFEERFSSISNVFVESSFEKMEDLKKRSDLFIRELERSKTLVSSILTDYSKMLKDIESVMKEIDNLLNFLNRYKSIVDKEILPGLSLSNYQIPRIHKKTLTSKRILDEFKEFVSSSEDRNY